jgi:hypothetical protein
MPKKLTPAANRIASKNIHAPKDARTKWSSCTLAMHIINIHPRISTISG